MKRPELRERLQHHFNDTVYYTQEDLDDSIQDGLDEVCAFTGCIWQSAQLPFQAGVTYYDLLTLLPDYIGIIGMFNKTTKKWMMPSGLRKFNEDRVDWDSTYGTPEFFTPVNHRYVAIYGKPMADNYGDMVVFYRAAAPYIDDVADIPIPSDHIDALESYSITDLWEQAQEWGKATRELKTYIENLDSLRIQMRNKRNSDRAMGLK